MVRQAMNRNAAWLTSSCVTAASTSRAFGPVSANPTVASEMSRTSTPSMRWSWNQRMCQLRR